MTSKKANVGQYIRTTVSSPEYFSLGQVGEIAEIIVDNESIDGYAYYVKFDGEVFWFLDCDEFELATQPFEITEEN